MRNRYTGSMRGGTKRVCSAPEISAETEGSELLDRALQFCRDPLSFHLWRKSRRGADGYRDLVGTGHMLSRLLQVVKAIDAHGNNWYSQVLHQQANAGTERQQLARRGVLSFGENQNAVTAVH